MADNVGVTPGAGAVIATDDVGGVQFQRVKLDLGGDGVSSPVVDALPVSDGTTALIDAVASPTARGALVLGIRRDGDSSPVSADGDYHPLTFNQLGRLKVSVTPADTAATTGNITASAQTVFIDCSRISNLAVSMVATSLVGHNITFEASNNSTTGSDGNWYGVQVVRSNANTVETTSGVLTATPAYMWQVNVNDYRWFRVRATAHTSGTAAYTLQPSAFATEPIPASQVTGTQPVSGTVSLGTSTAAIGSVLAPVATWTSRGGTVTTGGTAQQIAASNASRRGFFIQNNSAGDLWFSPVATAVASQPSIKIPAGALYECPYSGCPTGAISLIGATTGQAFSAMEY